MRNKSSLQGLIAIDIDGTLTAVRDALSPVVIDFLHTLVEEGWQLLFVTGRTVAWSLHLLEKLPFSYVFASFNGAYIVKMPECELIEKRFIAVKKLTPFVDIIKSRDAGMVVYGPPTDQRPYYFLPHYASQVVLHYLEARREALKEEWEEVVSVRDIPLQECAAVRLFALPEVAKEMSLDIEEKTSFHAPLMKDSFDARFSVVQVTHALVSKGHALESVFRYFGKVGRIIACGDDHNDIPMLKKADHRVVMATAPPEVLALADIIAPPAHELGIIEGLKRAIQASS